MVVKTSGWGVVDLATANLWASCEEEGEAMDDYVATDAEFLASEQHSSGCASELAAIEGELDALRAHFRTCKRAYYLSASPAVRKEACRKGRAILGKAEELLVAKAMLA